MDAAIEHLKEARKLEGQKEDTAAWDALSAEEQSDASSNLESARESSLALVLRILLVIFLSALPLHPYILVNLDFRK